MNNSDFFADTNALIYILNGDSKVLNILSDCNIWVSFVSEIELKSKKNLSVLELEKIDFLLSECFIIDVNKEIKDLTSLLRRNSPLKLPDAIIAASSIVCDLPIVTADKAFEKIEGIRLVSI